MKIQRRGRGNKKARRISVESDGPWQAAAAATVGSASICQDSENFGRRLLSKTWRKSKIRTVTQLEGKVEEPHSVDLVIKGSEYRYIVD